MKLKLMFLAIALSLCAAAQTIGLPTVELIGNPNNPDLVNKADKAIIATAVVRTNGFDRPHIDRGIALEPPIPVGGQVPVLPPSTGVLTINGVPDTFQSTAAVVDLAVFIDGTMIGPDSKGSADELAERFKAIVKAGQMALSGQWDELAAMRPSKPATPPDHELYVRADKLSWTRNHKGETEALAVAKFYASLPTTFRR